MRFQRIRSLRSFARPFLLAAGLLLILSLAACDTIAPSTNADPNVTPVVNAGTPNTDNSTPTATATSASTPTSGPTQATNSTPTATTIVPFRLTGVNAANPSNYSGVCGATKAITITGTIYAPANSAGGTATYEWMHSDNSTSSHRTITFAPGVTALTVTDSWSLSATKGNGTTKYWAELKTLAPETWTSGHATFSFTCKREITGASASVTPASGCTSVAKVFAFTGTITISPSPSTSSVTVSYSWKRSNGASSQKYTVVVPAGQTTVTVTPDSWSLSAKGTYTDKIVTSAPNTVTSNTAKITC